MCAAPMSVLLPHSFAYNFLDKRCIDSASNDEPNNLCKLCEALVRNSPHRICQPSLFAHTDSLDVHNLDDRGIADPMKGNDRISLLAVLQLLRHYNGRLHIAKLHFAIRCSPLLTMHAQADDSRDRRHIFGRPKYNSNRKPWPSIYAKVSAPHELPFPSIPQKPISNCKSTATGATAFAHARNPA